MGKITLFIFLIVAKCSGAYGQSRLTVHKTTLLNADLKKQRLSKIIDNQPFVLVFYTTECPICQKYVPILRGLTDCFPSVKFIAVFTETNTTAEFQAFTKNTPLSILPFFDKKNRLAHRLQVIATPEAFLFDAKGTVKYRGAIDNFFFALGKYRAAATEHYLSNAVSSFLKNEKIKIEKTTPIGCFIE